MSFMMRVFIVFFRLQLQLGPRLTLQLVKIEAGLCSGEVLHHEFSKTFLLTVCRCIRYDLIVQKTSKEMKQLRKLFKERRQDMTSSYNNQ